MNTATLPQQRLVLVLGGLAVAGLALFMVTRLGLVGGSDAAAPAPAPVAAKPQPAPQSSAGTTGITLLPGLPPQVAKALRSEQVVVVSLYASQAPGDRAAVTEARKGAAAVGAGFVAMNVFDEKKARALDAFAETTASPAVLVVRRPGRIVTRLNGFAETALVAQAAQNAGARR